MVIQKILNHTISSLVSLTLLAPLPLLAQSTSNTTQGTPIPVTDIEPPEFNQGTAEDLSNLQQQTNRSNNWGIGGRAPTNTIPESPYRETGAEPGKKEPTNLDIYQDHQDWTRTNQGDEINQGGKIPLTRF